MDQRYKNLLPATGQTLLERIEQFAGLEVVVELNDGSRPVPATRINQDAPELILLPNSATIFIQSEDVDPDGLVHEMLHIERYWLEKVPQIYPLTDDLVDNWTVTSSIENTLEHLVIVPRQANYETDPYPYWVEVERAVWTKYPWPEMTNDFARRNNALLGAAATFQLVDDKDVVALARDALAREGILKEAVRYSKRLKDVLHSKQKMLALTLQHLGISRSEVRLIEFDVRARQRYQITF